MRDTNQGLRKIDTEFRNVMSLGGVDPRLIMEMQYIRDALGAVKVNLSAMDMVAEQVLGEIAEAK